MVNPDENQNLTDTLNTLPANSVLTRAFVQAAIDAQLPQGGFAFSPAIVTSIIGAITGLETQINGLLTAQTPSQ